MFFWVPINERGLTRFFWNQRPHHQAEHWVGPTREQLPGHFFSVCPRLSSQIQHMESSCDNLPVFFLLPGEMCMTPIRNEHMRSWRMVVDGWPPPWGWLRGGLERDSIGGVDGRWVGPYVYVYVYIYIYVSVCVIFLIIFIYIYKYTYVYIHIYIYVCVCAYGYVCIYIYTPYIVYMGYFSHQPAK